MSTLSRDQIMAAEDLTREIVAVPEWGGEVLVKALTGTERDQYEASIMRLNGTNATLNLANARAKLCALAMVDESGARLFSDQDIAALAGKSAAALERIYAVAARLAGISAGDLEELSKKSNNGQHAVLSIA